MKLIPAIDIKDGQAVRLYKGDFNKKTIYHEHPEQLANQFEKMGADILHVVDLDGAKNGSCVNLETIKKIRANTHMPIELGGGIRTMETIDLYLEEVGINRVILGTVALKNPQFTKEALNKYGSNRIVIGVDIKDGYVSTAGWLDTSVVEYLTFIKELEKIGVRYIIVTDISKDGTLEGPNFDLYEEIAKHTNINIIVSGGIKDQADVLKVAKLGYDGCIIGKAYYEGKINIEEVIQCLKKESYRV